MRGIEKMAELPDHEFWSRCSDSWLYLYEAACDLGDVARMEFWDELSTSADSIHWELWEQVEFPS